MMNQPNNINRNFRGQQAAEKVLCFCRKHFIVLVRPFLLTAMIMGTLVFSIMLTLQLRGGEEWPWRLVLVGAFFTLTVAYHTFFLRLVQYYLEMFVVTNYRVIDLEKSVFIHDDKEMVDLHEIQDIKKNQDGVLANLLNYGDITITTASTISSMVLQKIPHPDYYLNRINEGKRHYILERRTQKGVDGTLVIPTNITPMPANPPPPGENEHP